jgi:hypothetical protein
MIPNFERREVDFIFSPKIGGGGGVGLFKVGWFNKKFEMGN